MCPGSRGLQLGEMLFRPLANGLQRLGEAACGRRDRGLQRTPIAGIADLHKLLPGREIGVRSELTISRHTELLRLPITPREAIFSPADATR